MPSEVRVDAPVDVSTVALLSAFDTPKSVTSAWLPEMRMFSGLMSRCTTPCEWA